MKTIAAISTPNAPGGIAMIRISGDDAISLAAQIFTPLSNVKVTEMRGYSCAYGTVAENGEPLDDVVCTVFRAPHSFTGEDTVEITCHGGIYLTKRILALILRAGAEPAGPGEFTKRAYLNGKMSLSQAEAVMDMIRADGEAALRQANLAKDGILSRKMQEISSNIIEILSAFAYWLDDAEEFPPELERSTLQKTLADTQKQLAQAAKDYQNGRVLREGIRTVLLGRPNAGKSSVMNRLCGMQRSIVTDIAGTTRDVITEQVKIGDYTLVLSDTAGLRETDNVIESIGISQAYDALRSADLVLYVIDAHDGISDEDRNAIAACGDCKVLVLWNKTDLTDVKPPTLDYPILSCSMVRDDVIDLLADALREVFPYETGNIRPVIMNERQFALIQQAEKAVCTAVSQLEQMAELDMIYTDLETAAHALRAIDGDDVTDDVIDGVFSRFCVGK